MRWMTSGYVDLGRSQTHLYRTEKTTRFSGVTSANSDWYEIANAVPEAMLSF